MLINSKKSQTKGILCHMSVKKIKGYRIFIDQKLGKGAYGTVYKGQNEDNGTPVAVKILDKSNINADPYMKNALISEIKIMKTVRSRNIVGFYDVMESKNNYYIIQQFCDGGDLEHFLSKIPNRRCKEPEAIKMLTDICNGFLVLVKEGIVHRDLKPANILLSGGQMKIGDFGFAKKTQTGLKNQTTVGTPLYMSLQILKGEAYTSKCDIWAIGFLFYEMLHGKTPWTAKSQYDLIRNIESQPYKLLQNLSDATVDFLKKTLQNTEDKRIGWQQLFAHEIFKGHFSQQLKMNEGNLQDTFKKIMGDIRFQINSNNIDLMKLWKGFGYGDDKQLNQKQFKDFLKCVMPKMAPAEESYFYKKMDINKDGSISLKQIQFQFGKYNIPLTSQFSDRLPFLLKKMVSLDEDGITSSKTINQDQSKQQTEALIKARDAFRKMDYILTKKNATLYKVFNVFDKDKSGQLDLVEFGKILKNLDKSIGQEQIKTIFEIVDTDNSNSIQFDELNSYYCKVNGIPESLSLPSDYKKKKQEQKQ